MLGGLFTVVMSCAKKDAAEPLHAPLIKNTNGRSNARSGDGYKRFWTYETNCINDVRHDCFTFTLRGKRKDNYDELIPKIQTNDNLGIVNLFTSDYAFYADELDSSNVNGVINGTRAIHYHFSTSLNRNWFTFVDLSTNDSNFVAIPIE